MEDTDCFLKGKSNFSMDDLGVPPFRKPPYVITCYNSPIYKWDTGILGYSTFWGDLPARVMKTT